MGVKGNSICDPPHLTETTSFLFPLHPNKLQTFSELWMFRYRKPPETSVEKRCCHAHVGVLIIQFPSLIALILIQSLLCAWSSPDKRDHMIQELSIKLIQDSGFKPVRVRWTDPLPSQTTIQILIYYFLKVFLRDSF